MKDSFAGRLVAEFVVIVAGVLLALAADRWNQGRADTTLESAYMSRLAAEIRADSVQLESRLQSIPESISARDSLLGVLDGSVTPPNLVLTIARATPAFYLRPPSTWRELEATGSLNVLRDPAVREALSRYYGSQRVTSDRAFERVQNRGREPLYDEMYRLRIFEPTIGEDGKPITALAEAAGRIVPDIAAFRNSPEVRPLLSGLGSMYFFQAIDVATALRNANAVLEILEAAAH